MEKRETDWLEEALSDLGARVREQAKAPPAVAARVAALVGASAPAAQERVSPLYLPVLTALLFALLFPLADFDASAMFNACKILLLLLALAGAALFLLYPGLMARLDRRLLAGVRLRLALAPEAAADLVFFRLQGLYFLFIAFFIARV